MYRNTVLSLFLWASRPNCNVTCSARKPPRAPTGPIHALSTALGHQDSGTLVTGSCKPSLHSHEWQWLMSQNVQQSPLQRWDLEARTVALRSVLSHGWEGLPSCSGTPPHTHTLLRSAEEGERRFLPEVEFDFGSYWAYGLSPHDSQKKISFFVVFLTKERMNRRVPKIYK